MSRFKQPERFVGAGSSRPARGGAAAVAPTERPKAERPAAKTTVVSAVPRLPAAGPPEFSSVVAKVGLLATCGYLISPYLQDLTTQGFGVKPYLNVVSMVVMLGAWVACGTTLRGVSFRTGLLWLGFLLFAVAAIPFSYWPGGSATMMWGYFSRSYIIFFLLCAFATTYRNCRMVMMTNVIAGVLLLIDCRLFGTINDGGRLVIAGSYILENSNDLALQLLLDIGFFAYLTMQPRIWMRVAGAAGMVVSLYYVVKTASRGGLIAGVVFVAILVIFSRQRLVWIAAAVPILAIVLVLMPADTRHRFSMILADPDLAAAKTDQDVASIQSQIERTELMKDAMRYSITRPFFGVGPGEFMDAVWGDQHKAGKHPPALGTHNTYLEVSSECGLPAFFLYAAVVWACIQLNFKTYRQQRFNKDRDGTDAGRMAFCLFATSAGFAVSIFFHHLAYTGYLPLLAGMAVCLNASIGKPQAVRAPAAR